MKSSYSRQGYYFRPVAIATLTVGYISILRASSLAMICCFNTW